VKYWKGLALDKENIAITPRRGRISKITFMILGRLGGSMIVAGIDVGSVSTKVAMAVNNEMIYKVIIPTGWSPRQAGEHVLAAALNQAGVDGKADFVVATGYGRIALPTANKAVTEITCHARGVAYLLPETRVVIDIGGQDSKIIKIGAQGRVLDFVMNDKCAAGTGRFMEVIAARLGVDVAELSDLAKDETPIELNSMCTVFAESEVVGLLAKGTGKGEIVAGLHKAISRRIGAMVERINPESPIIFTGGVAQNKSLAHSLSTQLNMPVLVPEDCQFTGAIGAMLIAAEMAQAI
jgi:predicted CoA-substrate-specific enzyme activase